MQQAVISIPDNSPYPGWHYQPLRLLKDEMENPVEVIREFFSVYTLPQARKHFRGMLEDAMCKVEMYSINYLTFCNSIEKLIEAAWLIKQQENTDTAAPCLSGSHHCLHTLVQLLVVTIRPERIFLLSGKESEVVDLLIIVPGTTGKLFRHYGTLIEAVSYGMNLTFSLHASSVFHQHIEEGHPFWLCCCTEDKQVYTSVTAPFPQPAPEKGNAVRERMRTTFLDGMEKSWVFLESARANRLGGSNAVILFLLHQSAELIVRALILSLTGTEVREHSIAVLRKHLRRCAPEVCHVFPNDTEEEKALLTLLDSAYRKGRYDESFSPGKEQLNTLYKRVGSLHDSADAVFSAVLRSFPALE